MFFRIAETIVSRVTPIGISSVGIVRLSGSLSYKIAFAITKKHLFVRRAIYSSFFDKNNDIIDKGLAIFFKSPNSFTGEDILEIHSHGSNVILDFLLLRCMELGARIAEPGEFSFRAFYNNKIDLLQAESINQLVRSKSLYANKAILRSLDGVFSKEINIVRDKLIFLRGNIEGSIDFPDDIFLNYNDLIYYFNDLYLSFEMLLNKVSNNYFICDRFNVVIIGKTNVGKSSLFNLLLGKSRAIVSSIPGTTRDYINEEVSVGNNSITLIDTAGFNFDTYDLIEKESINRTYKQIKKANVLIFLLDIADKFDIFNSKIFNFVKNLSKNSIKLFVVRNKIDKLGIITKKIVHTGYMEFYVSVKKNIGINLLLFELRSIFFGLNNGLYMVNKRHYNLFFKAYDYLLRSKDKLNNNFLIDIFAEDLRIVHDCLSDIIGCSASDDLIVEIFSKFCVGK